MILLTCFVCSLALCGVRGQGSAVDQARLDLMANTLNIQWTVVTNTREVERFDATLTLTNRDTQPISNGEWTMYFYSVYPLEPDRLSRGKSLEIEGQGLEVMQVMGMLYKLTPTSKFRPIPPGGNRVLRLHMQFWSVAKSDTFPNWYLTGSQGTQPRTIASTAGDDAAFVSPPTKPQQQKRYDFDQLPTPTAQDRYHRNYVPYASPEAEVRVVPKPWRMNHMTGNDVTLSSAWRVFDASPGKVLGSEAAFIIEKLDKFSVQNATGSTAPTSNVIILNVGNIILSDDDVIDHDDDAHTLQVDDVNNVINVTGRGPSGVFLAFQTLLSLMRENGTVPKVNVYDAPRFSHRGLFLDLSRNFQSRAELERLLGVMAMYKMNRLHLHLADDEGWRIEIAGLPELTEVGAKRCHDLAENECLLPQLGSGPGTNNSGSGYLTASDYQSILRAAARHHIRVIPEIDVPGHAHAAIKAMEKRYRTYMGQNNSAEAEKYRLIDPDDDSIYTTPQFFYDNAINVCKQSSYVFITKVVQELKKLHETIQPLYEFHSGFDEVGKGAWVNSTICQQLIENDSFANESLKQYFFKRVADITHAEGLALGGWEDGLMLQGNQPFNRSSAANSAVYANVWDNVWEWGTSSRTHTLANMGYKVIMSHGTSLYFDHPYEPDWEDRGYYWATRATDTLKTFTFMPMNYYANIDMQRSGQPISREQVCGDDDVNCPPLLRPQNIVGMQGQLWSETVRTRDQVDSQLFPRLLALAERAWHFAAWEREDNATVRNQLRMADWYSFARAVGYRELPRLDALGINYRIPPPGAMVKRQKLLVATGYPGLVTEYSMDCGNSWKPTDGSEKILDSDRVWIRSRTADGMRYSRSVELMPVPELQATDQTLLTYMGDNLRVTFEVADNYLTYGARYYVIKLTLNNTGSRPIPEGNWEMHFPSVQWVEEEMTKEEREFVIQEHKMALGHVNGYLFRIAPVPGFSPLAAGTSREISFRGSGWSVSKFEQFPNYYVTAEGANAVVINNTVGESMSFVKDFSKVNQWKRDPGDKFDPLTPSARYGKQSDVKDLKAAPTPFLPSPLVSTMDRSKSVSLDSGWVIVVPQAWTELADFLQDQLKDKINVTVQSSDAASRYIEVRESSDGVPQSVWPGAYNITVSPELETIVIAARNTTGALYGIQSLLNMAAQSEDGVTLFKVTAADAPRFHFRGMYVDVARNFQNKEYILKLLRAMGMLKLNRLHLHLGDDEGWRLDIPGLPELTTVGSTRCYDPTEERCLIPVLGSGPNPDNAGSGFYTIQDYQEILAFAAQRHIEVIPEFDMPGHSRAAIKAMALRRRLKTEAGDMQGAHEYELDEMGDPSEYSSVQLFNDDAVNPCMDSSYRFIRHVMREVKQMHAGVNPLNIYHFGGDEVAEGAWIHSKACSEHVKNGTDLKLMFSSRVGALAAEEGLDLAAWEDGIMDKGQPIPRDEMKPRDVYANAWQNVWEWGAASRAHVLANEGYKVIMSQATHLYFDHPYEPDPEERGFYWATRATDNRKVFLFQPQHLWNNIAITRLGDPYTLKDVCGKDNAGCPDLKLKDNIVGMQGHLWAETVRTGEQLEYMIFPRLLALAERAWHASPWEGKEGGASAEKLDDWTSFANALGYGQLSVLDGMNISYRVCPPGVKQEGSQLITNTEFPGLMTQYLTSGFDRWQDVTNQRVNVRHGQTVHVRTLSADGQRSSAPVTMKVSINQVNTDRPSSSATSLLLRGSSLLLPCVLLAALRVLN